ncbi:MAG: hypothetical protein LAO56_15485 [Acidobacteriia bacterium]|nr:hypothetical protein [Terriglobia bacterium]
MIPSYRQAFNASFTPEKYERLRRELTARCGMEVPFALCETPCFFPAALVKRMGEDGKTLIHQLVDNPEYRARSEASIPAQFRVPNEAPHPMFVQVDFGLVRGAAGELQPKLVELQAFPSLYAYQPVLAQAYMDVFGLDPKLRYFLSGLDSASYKRLLQDAIVAGHDPANVVLMEIHPEEQKTRPDFLLTERLLGIRTVCISKIRKEGRHLFYEDDGRRVPIERIYNRTIVDELERKGVPLPFDFRDVLDVEWAGHPNWYFRISKYSIPYLKHRSVPRTWFLDELKQVPADLENFVLKPLYSFAGLGVVIAPTRKDIDAIPAAKRGEYILQERLNFTPVVETPYGMTKVELRIMYVWLNDLTPALTIVRMGRGLMMGVDHNKNMQWVGSSAALMSG